MKRFVTHYMHDYLQDLGVIIFVNSKALKQAHSQLCNSFSNAGIGKNYLLENRNHDCVKYN